MYGLLMLHHNVNEMLDTCLRMYRMQPSLD
jgi:hypothetical protein